ncbi:Homeobox protein tos8 [Marasmius sp. AFHP31]|nr:Homeobox protein tos8 [Marasmius sp. AFHP31]
MLLLRESGLKDVGASFWNYQDLEPETKPWSNTDGIFNDSRELLIHLKRYGREAGKAMTSLCSETAPSVMDKIQLHLDSKISSADTVLRRTCIHCLLHLNKYHGSLPTSFHLSNIVKEGTHPVAGGGFSDIWKGRLGEAQSVCLKVLRVFTGSFDERKLMKQLGNEVLIWRQLRHPNIHQFLGVTNELFQPSYCIVSPWMTNGDVMSYCRERNSGLDIKLRMMQEMCEGIRYLHEHDPPIVHSDIKGINLLVDDDDRCRISDFGLCTIEEDSPQGRVSASASQAAMRGSVPWLAPELMNPSCVEAPNRTTRDIYALGCTMYELLAGNPPFSDKKMEFQIIMEVLGGIRPARPVECPDGLWTVIEKCWQEQSGSRMTASEVAIHLVDMTTPASAKGTLVTTFVDAEALPAASESHPSRSIETKETKEKHLHARNPPSESDEIDIGVNSQMSERSHRQYLEIQPASSRPTKRNLDEVDYPSEDDTLVKRQRRIDSPKGDDGFLSQQEFPAQPKNKTQHEVLRHFFQSLLSTKDATRHEEKDRAIKRREHSSRDQSMDPDRSLRHNGDLGSDETKKNSTTGDEGEELVSESTTLSDVPNSPGNLLSQPSSHPYIPHADRLSISSSYAAPLDVTHMTVPTRNASHNRRKQEATFHCPVPGCRSTFTRSFNLKAHLRTHNEDRPFVCQWPGCGKDFARHHDYKRHEQAHSNHRVFQCEGCHKPFARMEALNRHLRSEGSADCQRIHERKGSSPSSFAVEPSLSSERDSEELKPPATYGFSIPPSSPSLTIQSTSTLMSKVSQAVTTTFQSELTLDFDQQSSRPPPPAPSASEKGIMPVEWLDYWYEEEQGQTDGLVGEGPSEPDTERPSAPSFKETESASFASATSLSHEDHDNDELEYLDKPARLSSKSPIREGYATIAAPSRRSIAPNSFYDLFANPNMEGIPEGGQNSFDSKPSSSTQSLDVLRSDSRAAQIQLKRDRLATLRKERLERGLRERRHFGDPHPCEDMMIVHVSEKERLIITNHGGPTRENLHTGNDEALGSILLHTSSASPPTSSTSTVTPRVPPDDNSVHNAELTSLEAYAPVKEQIEYRRRQNVLAARKSRKRKLERWQEALRSEGDVRTYESDGEGTSLKAYVPVEEKIEYRRRQYTLAARRSRKRKLGRWQEALRSEGDVGAHESDGESSDEKNRQPGACVQCKKLKIRCEYLTNAPPCERCTNEGLQCARHWPHAMRAEDRSSCPSDLSAWSTSAEEKSVGGGSGPRVVDTASEAIEGMWEAVSLQAAWKGFRARVGTSELAGVPAILLVD